MTNETKDARPAPVERLVGRDELLFAALLLGRYERNELERSVSQQEE